MKFFSDLSTEYRLLVADCNERTTWNCENEHMLNFNTLIVKHAIEAALLFVYNLYIYT